MLRMEKDFTVLIATMTYANCVWKINTIIMKKSFIIIKNTVAHLQNQLKILDGPVTLYILGKNVNKI
jgi:hypothetical protein